jgi:hypothetical protein
MPVLEPVDTTEIGDLEEFIRTRLKSDAVLVGLLGGEHFYAYQAKPDLESGTKAVVVYTITPLRSKQGQTRRINTLAMVDLKVIVDGAPTDETERMQGRFDALFAYVVRERAGNHSFSMRGEKPINYREPKPGTEEFYFHRGWQYRTSITLAN